MQTVLLQ